MEFKVGSRFTIKRVMCDDLDFLRWYDKQASKLLTVTQYGFGGVWVEGCAFKIDTDWIDSVDIPMENIQGGVGAMMINDKVERTVAEEGQRVEDELVAGVVLDRMVVKGLITREDFYGSEYVYRDDSLAKRVAEQHYHELTVTETDEELEDRVMEILDDNMQWVILDGIEDTMSELSELGLYIEDEVQFIVKDEIAEDYRIGEIVEIVSEKEKKAYATVNRNNNNKKFIANQLLNMVQCNLVDGNGVEDFKNWCDDNIENEEQEDLVGAVAPYVNKISEILQLEFVNYIGEVEKH